MTSVIGPAAWSYTVLRSNASGFLDINNVSTWNRCSISRCATAKRMTDSMISVQKALEHEYSHCYCPEEKHYDVTTYKDIFISKKDMQIET
jgi:hypothetical protein